MPEGDTVFLTAHRLHEALAGRELVSTDLRHPELAEVDLAGRTVESVAPVGKHLLARFSGGLTLHSHLRMDGSWHLYPPGGRWQRPGHQARVLLEVPDRLAVGFRVHDLALVDTAAEHRLVGHLGPDLLDPDWSDAHAAEALRRLRACADAEMGLALLDQRVVAGIGNIYKNETCFLLGAYPWTPVSAADDELLARAVRVARKLLLRNRWHPEQSTTGELGRGREHWVYRRAGKPCRRCGATIEVGEQGADVYARTAWFCPTCQPGQVSSI